MSDTDYRIDASAPYASAFRCIHKMIDHKMHRQALACLRATNCAQRGAQARSVTWLCKRLEIAGW